MWFIFGVTSGAIIFRARVEKIFCHEGRRSIALLVNSFFQPGGHRKNKKRAPIVSSYLVEYNRCSPQLQAWPTASPERGC